MFRKLLIVTAVSAAYAAHPAFAQQQQSQQSQQSQQAQQSQQTQQSQQRQQSQVQAGADGAPVHISSAAIRQIQQALNKQGFDVGTVDGQWGEQTVQAAQNYQRSKGMAPTETLTLGLINSLGLNDLLTEQQRVSGLQAQAEGPGTPLYLSPTDIRQIQQALNKQGFDPGHVDGQWGESTAQAAANFQRSKGMEPTGMPDPNLIAALGEAKTILTGSGEQATGGMPPEEAAAGEGVQLWTSPSTVRQVEQALNKQGFNPGKIDGQWDEQTAQAVQKFQQKQGIEQTGTLTPSVLASVGMKDWIEGKGGQQQSSGQSGQQSSGQSGKESKQQ